MFTPESYLPRLLTRLAACLAALALAPALCEAAPAPTPLGLVPAGGAAVMRLDWSAVRADPLLRSAVKADELEKVFAQVGVRAEEVSEAVVFIDIANLNRAGAAMILKGPRLRPALGALRSRGWGERDFRGYRLHTEGAGDGCLAQLRSGYVVAGARATVERVIGVESGAGRPLSSDASFRRLLAHVGVEGQPVSLLMVLPAEYEDAGDVLFQAATLLLDMTGFSPLGTLLGKVGLARGVGFSFGRGRGGVPLSLVALMRDEGGAGLISGTLTLLKGAASLMPAQGEADRQAKQVFEGMTVTRTREVVSVRLTLPESAAFAR